LTSHWHHTDIALKARDMETTIERSCKALVSVLRAVCPLWLCLLCALLLSGLWSASELAAQPVSTKSIRDNKGKEFYLAFLENEHANSPATDKLVVIVSSDVATRGELTYTSRTSGNLVRVPFTISDPTQVATIDLPTSLEVTNAELPLRGQSIYLRADNDVTVYGLNTASQTSDAFLAFPVDVLGRDHVVASYLSHINVTGNQSRTPSQFLVIASEDDTDVLITPSSPLRSQPVTESVIKPITVRLNKGDVYLCVAALTNRFGGAQSVFYESDLTGSRVKSNKPVVVYGSHFRTPLPITTGTSRDHLIEQMPPVETWGRRAFVTPFPAADRGGATDTGGDIFRVIAANDSTVVSINGRVVTTLAANKFLESSITQTSFIESNQPILIVAYKRSAGQGGATTGNGDPFMTIVPPAEQFLNRYRFVSVQSTQRVGAVLAPAFNQHYVQVVIPTRYIASLRLDGGSPPSTTGGFQPIAGTTYSYANFQINEGTHNIVADTTFGITALGYGQANSYGYVAGQRFETDVISPRISIRAACDGGAGAVYDSAIVDSKVFWVNTPEDSWKNVRVSVGAFPRPADSVTFRAVLNNRYDDGEFTMTVIDSLELRTTQRIFVPGFTVHADPRIRDNSAITYSTSAVAVAAGVERCYDVTLTNYGATTQTISAASFASGRPEFTVRAGFRTTSVTAVTVSISTTAVLLTTIATNTPLTFPFTLRPRERASVQMCFRSDSDGIFTDTLRIANVNESCTPRPIAVFQAESAFDRTPPLVSRAVDSCATILTYSATDRHRYAAGVDVVEVLRADNCTVRSERSATSGTVQTIVNISDPRRDAIVMLNVRDSVGNVTAVRDTIQTLSLRFLPALRGVSGANAGVGGVGGVGATNAVVITTGTTSLSSNGAVRTTSLTFPTLNATALTCGTVQIVNDGVLPFRVDRIGPASNTTFSMPPAQFPIVVPPGGQAPCVVCFNPQAIAMYRDTLRITRGCLSETLVLSGSGSLSVSEVNSRCVTPLIIRAVPGANLVDGNLLVGTVPSSSVNAAAQTNSAQQGQQGQQAQDESMLTVATMPDPASDVLVLRLRLAAPQRLSLALHTMIGEAVLTLPARDYDAGEWEIEMNVSRFESGVYCYRFVSEGASTSLNKNAGASAVTTSSTTSGTTSGTMLQKSGLVRIRH
jgi:hypothetical protein